MYFLGYESGRDYLKSKNIKLKVGKLWKSISN